LNFKRKRLGPNDIVSVSFDGFKKDLLIRSDIPLKDDVSFLVDDEEVHGLCMSVRLVSEKIDSAVVPACGRQVCLVECRNSYGPPLLDFFVLLIIPLCGILREALMSIKSLKWMAKSPHHLAYSLGLLMIQDLGVQ